MKKAIPLLTILCFGLLQLKAQDSFRVQLKPTDKGTVSGCEELLITYTYEYYGSTAPDSVEAYGNGKKIIATDNWSVAGKKWSLQMFLGPGKYGHKVKIYRNGKTTFINGDSVIIYKKPTAKFKILGDTSQCSKNNEFCLVDYSNIGNASVLIDWDDGNYSSYKNISDTFCHGYNQAGSFDIIYKITDKNGCSSSLKRNLLFATSPRIEASFYLKQSKLDSASQLQDIVAKLSHPNNREIDSIIKTRFNIIKIADIYGNSFGYDSVIFIDSLALKNDGFVNLNDSIITTLEPGQYFVESVNENKQGCKGTNVKEIRIGYLATYRIKQACAGGETQFFDSIYYWNKRGNVFCELNGSASWNTTCIDTNSFFYSSDKVRTREYGRFPNYTKPKYKERIGWDFENDGVIDLWDTHNPSHVYNDPGTYECAMWTMDSLGQWQKSIKEVTVAGAQVSITLAKPAQKYVCIPDTVHLKVRTKLYYDSIKTIEFLGKLYYNRDSFDIFLPIHNNLISNYKVEAITKTGCLDNFQDTNLFTILGPKVNFNRVTDPEICIGTQMVYNSTGDTGTYSWFVNNKLSSTKNQLSYTPTSAGLYDNILLRVSQSITHPKKEEQLTCYGTATLWDTSNQVTNVLDSKKLSFEIHERLPNDSVAFKLLVPDPYFNSFNYSINKGAHKSLNLAGSNFVLGFSKNGNYTICVYYENSACSDTFCKTIWVDNVGINDDASEYIQLYPNPTSGNSTLIFPNENGKYEIIDITGRIMQAGSLTKGTNNLPTQSLNAGSYFVRIINENGHFEKKLIKN